MSSFKAGFLNMNSLRAHVERLRVFLNDQPTYHVFGIAESWLSQKVEDSIIQVQGFSIIRQDRNANGGGVALFVRNDFKAKILATSNTQGPGKPGIPEYLFYEVRHGNSPPILVAVIYRPPKIAFQRNSDLFQVLRDHFAEYSHKIIMDDLNADLIMFSDNVRTVSRLFAELSLCVVQHGPTHHTTYHTSITHTRIDMILIDENDTNINYSNEWLPTFGKHSIIDVAINLYVPAPIRESFSYKNYGKMETAELCDLLSCQD